MSELCYYLLMLLVVTLISCDNVDILTFSETWVDETINDSKLSPIDGYNIIKRGEVAVIFSPNIRYRPHCSLSEGNIETLQYELFPNTKRSMLVCCAYRPLSQNNFYDCLLSECLKTLTKTTGCITTLGDLNSEFSRLDFPQSKCFWAYARSYICLN